jgi:hypothetical protein
MYALNRKTGKPSKLKFVDDDGMCKILLENTASENYNYIQQITSK